MHDSTALRLRSKIARNITFSYSKDNSEFLLSNQREKIRIRGACNHFVEGVADIDDLRKIKLMEMAKDVKFGIIYVSAFLDKNDFRKFSKDIAFNTEAWISDYPDRMIHFNGHKFLGPLND